MCYGYGSAPDLILTIGITLPLESSTLPKRTDTNSVSPRCISFSMFSSAERGLKSFSTCTIEIIITYLK